MIQLSGCSGALSRGAVTSLATLPHLAMLELPKLANLAHGHEALSNVMCGAAGLIAALDNAAEKLKPAAFHTGGAHIVEG